MPEITAETSLQIIPCISSVIRIAVCHIAHGTGKDRSDEKKCQYGEEERQRAVLDKRERRDKKKEYCYVDNIQKNHADEIIPAVKKSLFYEKSFHIYECTKPGFIVQGHAHGIFFHVFLKFLHKYLKTTCIFSFYMHNHEYILKKNSGEKK